MCENCKKLEERLKRLEDICIPYPEQDYTIVDHLNNEISTLKKGIVEPDRCETCDYCIHTKVLKAPINYIHYSELIQEI